MALEKDEALRRTVDFLAHVPLLRHARRQDLETIANVAEHRTYDPRDVVFWQGSEGRELYIVEAGEVVITQRLVGHVETVVARFGPRDYFGEMRVFMGGPRTATAQTTEETSLIVIPGERLIELVESVPETGSRLLLALVEELVDRLTETNARFREAIMWGLDATGHLDAGVGLEER